MSFLVANRENTARLAKALWSLEANTLSSSDFQARFDAIYSASEGIATLWHLGGAANDYLRHHPGSIVVPQELPLTLLASRLVNGRIVGLKLLTRLSGDSSLVSYWICRSLESSKRTEVYGGLHELHNYLDRFSQIADAEGLLSRLSRLCSANDPVIHEQAKRLRERVSP